jgi:hypothetical protein
MVILCGGKLKILHITLAIRNVWGLEAVTYPHTPN